MKAIQSSKMVFVCVSYEDSGGWPSRQFPKA